jgi:hypothetical protein
MKNDSLEALKNYAEQVRKADYDYSHIFESLGHGLEVVFDCVVTWTFDVKVRRPWRLLGIVTDEKHQIFQRDIRTHIVTAALADELINPKIDRSLSLAEELSAYNFQIEAPDQATWPRSIHDWDDNESVYVNFQVLDTSTNNLRSIVASDEDGVLVAKSIMGFEGQEETLASIHRRKQAFLDGSVWEEEAELKTVTLVSEPKILLNDVEVSVADRRELLKSVAGLLPRQ